MAAVFKRDTVFLALTRPQMFMGVTLNFFVLNLIVCAEVFLISKSFWVIALALILHLAGVLLCLREPRFFDLWTTRMSRCPRVKNYRMWGCNSYRP
jgi:type IV secretion system protein VirB3